MAHKPMNKEPNQTPAKLGVFGGHRAGKRKRGTSVTKRNPRDTVRAYRMEIVDSETKLIVAMDATMISDDVRHLPDGHDAAPFAGTFGNGTMREGSAHTYVAPVIPAYLALIAICDRILREPVSIPDMPDDAVFPRYAVSKPIPPDRFGRGE